MMMMMTIVGKTTWTQLRLLDTMRLALRSVAKIVQEHDQKMRHLNQSRRKWCIIEGVVG